MKRMKRMLALILALVLMIGVVPVSDLSVSAAPLEVKNQVSDPSSLDGWKNYFGTANGISTEYAGNVWTDKTVLMNEEIAENFAGVTQSSAGTSPNLSVGDDNFLVALSALSSTKQITGYSATPSDTVFVLDISGSMEAQDLSKMVDSTNAAIEKLQNLNKYNRVGVVVFSKEVTTLLALDRYATTKIVDGKPRYLELDSRGYGGFAKYVMTAKSGSNYCVTGSDNEAEIAEAQASGSTFTQLGLNAARELFEEKYNDNDTSIDTGLIQGGVERIPILVMMSDGAPTYARSEYRFADGLEEDMGTGNEQDSVCDELIFVSQLTAAHVLTKMEEYYNREGLFYTVGLGLDTSEYRQKAISLVDPLNHTYNVEKLKTWWDAYKTPSSEATKEFFTYNTKFYDGTIKSATVKRLEDVAGINKIVANFPYTNKYFPAEDYNKLESAFDEVVNEIIIQSKYYPTLVTTGQYDMDGYVTIVDELGEHMEVKDVKGMVYKDKLFSGEALGKSMREGLYGNRDTWTELGWELVYTIKERLDVSNDVAIDLLSKAWQDEQLSYDSATGTFSNYIGYYVDAEGQYLGFWDKDHTELDYPVGTKYLGRSYLFQGTITNTDSSVEKAEMMHIVAQVYEDVDTGNQTVTWRVPASLVPYVLYEISVNGNVFNKETVQTLKCTEDTPIRFLYEVGLGDEITPLTLAEIMKEEDHKHPSVGNDGKEDGGYWFYSNRWGDGSGITELDPNNNKATVAYYNPSKENERYYYVEDTLIYLEDGTKYTGDTIPTDLYSEDDTRSGYVHYLTVASATGEAGVENKATASTTALQISKDVLALAQKDEDGNWYIPKGTIYQQVARNRVLKTNNETGTLAYVDYPKIVKPSGNDAYGVFYFHGNNGRMTVYPATGLKLTKRIDQPALDSRTDNFVFEIALSTNVTKEAISVTDADNNNKAYELLNGNTIAVTLAKDETVYITGLAPGTTYNVTERAHNDYVLDTVTDSGNGTVVQYVINDVIAKNIEKGKTGNLVVSKAVTHPYGSGYEIPSNKKFAITVELKNADGTAYANQSLTTSLIDAITTDASGKAVFQLAHNESVTINSLPSGVTYAVTENNLPLGFSLDIENSVNLTGTIVVDNTVSANVVNNYIPDPVNGNDVEFSITKNLTGRDWKEEDSFQFELYRWNVAENAWRTSPETRITITKGVENHKVSSTLENQSFNSIGTYWFKLEEVNGGTTQNGVTYDPNECIFGVVVEDTGMNGPAITKVIKSDGTDYENRQVDVTFVNTYEVGENAKASAKINIKKTLTNNTKVEVDLTKFEFGLYTAAENGELIKTVSANATGDAEFVMEYPGTVFDDGEKEKSYTYYVKEIKKQADEDGFVPGISYNETAYPVTVTVKDNQDGTMSAAVNYGDEEKSVITVNNVYELTPVKLSLGGTKKLTGRDMKQDEFTFRAYKTESDFVIADETQFAAEVKADAAFMRESVATDEFSFGEYECETKGVHYFVIKEQKGGTTENGVTYDGAEYHVTVNVDIDSTDKTKLSATQTVVKVGGGSSDIVFENIYTITDTESVVLEAQKTFSGKTLESGAFTFNLYKAACDEAAGSYSYSGTALQEKVGNTANTGKIQFEKIEYTQPGTHYYAIVENIPEEAVNGVYEGVTYDSDPVRYVKVVIADNGDGTLSSSVVPVSGNLTFTNSYAPNEKTITLKGTKAYVDEKYTLKPITETYKFALYPANLEGTNYVIDPAKTPITVEAQPAGLGTVNFAIPVTYKTQGTHYYVLKEVAGSSPTTIYDTKTYCIMDVVTDRGNGELYVNRQIYLNGAHVAAFDNSDTQYEFINEYRQQSVHASIGVKKVVVNNSGAQCSEEGFKFGLYESDSNKLVRDGLTDKDGNLIFDVAYTDTDIPAGQNSRAFNYYLKELGADKNGDGTLEEILGMSYDKKVYEVKVTLSYNAENRLTAVPEIRIENSSPVVGQAKFVNTYTLEPERDFTISGKKVLSGRTLKNSDFSFALYEASIAADGTWEKGAQIGTAVKNVGENFTFSNIETFNTESTYNYIVEEVIPTGANVENSYTLNGITYDPTSYQMKVTVAPSAEKAELVAEITEMKKVTYDEQNHPVVTEITSGFTTAIEFHNSYVTKGEFSISGTKELKNRDWNNTDVFTFGLYKANAQFEIQDTLPIAADTIKGTDSQKVFHITTDLTGAGRYYFVLKEAVGGDLSIAYDENEYRMVVDAMDNGDGTMKIGKYDENTETFKENEFVIQKVHQPKELAFLHPAELLDEDVTPEEIVFTNSYKTVPVSITIDGAKELTDSKTGREIVDDEFSFELYSAKVEGNIWSKNQWIAKATNKGNGFEMKDVLSYEEAGIFYYIVSEESGDNAIVSYDTAEHRIKVVVEETGKNSSHESILKATLYYVDENGNETKITENVKLTEFIKFSNAYHDAQTNVFIKKVVKSTENIAHTKEGFKFRLKDVTNNKVYKNIVSDKEGQASITLQYNEFDIGQTYQYELSEVNTGEKDMKYDETVYHIDVVISVDNTTKQLITTVFVDGEVVTEEAEVVFENIYSGKISKPDKPQKPNKTDKQEKPEEVVVIPPQTTIGASTGDTANIVSFALLATVSVFGLVGMISRKRKKIS